MKIQRIATLVYQNITEKFVDSIFPRRCPVCQEIVDKREKYICKSCLPKLGFVKSPNCMRCGKEIQNIQDEFCLDCQRYPKSFEYGRALLNYDDISENAMIQIKYYNKREYLEGFAKLLVIRYKNIIQDMKADAFIPIPIHRKRLQQRGYNQAEILANYISREMNLPVFTGILERKKNTIAQKGLSVEERLKNLSDAFQSRTLPLGIQNIILVDDIYTTGSTIEACTRVLHQQGAKKVYFLSICIGKGA